MADRELVPLNTKMLSPAAKKAFDFVTQEVVGQDMSILAITEALEMFNSPLRNPSHPIFVGLFLGPSGVGKTLTAEKLAQFLFEDPCAFTKINCSELSQEHEVARLKGSPPGYIGFIDSTSPEARKSPHPLLSQWNIDKYHHEYLTKVHRDELRAIVDRANAMKTGDIEISTVLKRRFAEESKAKEIARRIRAIVARRGGKSKFRKSAELKALREKLANHKKEMFRLTKIVVQRSLRMHGGEQQLRVDIAAAKKNGWYYDFEHPPTELLSIILFDEVEKAHPTLFSHLLEIMDKGKFQLGDGSITSFQNSVIILTGNVGRDDIANLLTGEGRMGFRQGQVYSPETIDLNRDIYRVVVEKMKETFPPEFIGRLDKVIVFRPLTYDAVSKILDILIRDLHTELVKYKSALVVNIEKPVRDFLIDKSMERTEYGARMLKSRLKKYVKNKLVRLLNTGQLKAGDTVVVKLETINGKQKPAFYKEEPTQLGP